MSKLCRRCEQREPLPDRTVCGYCSQIIKSRLSREREQ